MGFRIVTKEHAVFAKPLKKTTAFLFVIALTAIALTDRHVAAESPSDRPNVLFIAVDDLKPLLGCYGFDHIKSPSIDRLAEQGTVFLNAHCQQAVCAPSRISLLTGLRPDTTKVWDLKTRIRDILPNVVTLPQHFKNNGYQTVGVGKIFDPRSIDGHETMDKVSWSRPYRHPECRADETFGYLNPLFVEVVKQRMKEGAEKGLKGYELQKSVGRLPTTDWAEVPDEAYQDGAFAADAIEMLGELAKNDDPFFLAVGFKKPHLPFNAPKKYWDLYDPAQIQLAEFREMPKDAPSFHYQPGWEIRAYDVPKKGRLSEEKQRELIHGYYACVSYVDAQVGKLLDALHREGLTKNTIVILWGDHGWHLGDHSMWCKHTNYEQATRSPLIIAAPGLREMGANQRGNQSNSPVEFVDIFPTMCELAGIPVPQGMHGTSLTPIMMDPSATVKPVAISQFPRYYQPGKEVMGYAIRDHRYRYIEWIQKDYKAGETTGPTVARELYDYQKDALETRNLIVEPDYKEVAAKMKALFRTYVGVSETGNQ